jgi:hypothetical protein
MNRKSIWQFLNDILTQWIEMNLASWPLRYPITHYSLSTPLLVIAMA